MKVYFDNAASTRVDPRVLDAMKPYFTDKYGNASSLHSYGTEAKEALESAREKIARSINAKPEEIIFTSGGTEANNFALKSIAFTNKDKGKHIITSKIEHDCVLNTCKWLEQQGFEITYLNVDKEGFVSLEQLEEAIRKDTVLVSIMHANNEIGTIEPIEEIGKLCREKGVYFHTDACQSFTKVRLDVEKQNLDLATINAHKIHGPKGVGALYVRKGTNVKAWQHGGGHEFGLRSGTENVPGAVGFAKAVELAKPEHVEHMRELRDLLISGLLEIPHTHLNGPKGEKRLCNNANISFHFIEGESMLFHLDMRGIAVSTGSACSSKSLEPSHVLRAIGPPHEISHGTIRFSLSRESTKEEVEYVVKNAKEVVEELRKISPLAKQ